MTESGAQRYLRSREAGIKDRAVALRFPPKRNDELAKLAEEFFAEQFDCVQFLYRTDGPDGGIDLIFGRYVVQVKWTDRRYGCLIDLLTCKRVASIYVLVVGMPGSFRVVGWNWAKVLWATTPRRMGGDPEKYPLSYCLPQSALLTDTGTIVEILKRHHERHKEK